MRVIVSLVVLGTIGPGFFSGPVPVSTTGAVLPVCTVYSAVRTAGWVSPALGSALGCLAGTSLLYM